MFLSLTLTLKITQNGKKKTLKGPKKCKRVPKCCRIKLKYRAVLSKPKSIIYIGRYKNVFESEPNPKNIPKGPKKCKNAPILAKFKTKRLGGTFKTKIDSLRY